MEKITRAYLQTSKEKEIIVGSYMYMPFQGEDKELIDKTVNMVGSGLYPLGLSLLLPLFLYTLLSEKEEKILEIMKMNGLNLRVYWLHFFLFCFLVSLVTSFVFFAFGRWVIEIDFFVSTSSSVLWAVFIAWNISQISLTTFVQIFINSSRSGTIIGYLSSIFSTLIGVTMCTVIFPYPI